MIRFAHPVLLNLLWGGLLLVLLAVLDYRWRLAAMRRWARDATWNTALPHRAPGRILLKRILHIGALLAIVFSLSGPQVGTHLVEVTREGCDLAIAMDVSQSMMAEDIAPSRMLRARHEVTRLLDQIRGDRVALVPFAGVAFVQVPLTLDYGAVVSILNALEPGMIPQPGTSLAEAIKQARRAFQAEGKAQKVLLIISDGEDHEPGALAEAKEAGKAGIKIFTVGMATAAGGPIPVKDERGRVSGYKKDSGGQTVISRLNEKTLQDIAGAAGGEYYRATSSGGEFKQIYKKIAGLDKEQFESKEYTDWEDRFQWPISAACVLIIIGEFIPPGRRRRPL
jgi:Ca-activated chloride channel family protein